MKINSSIRKIGGISMNATCICWYNWEYGYLSFEKELPPRLAKMICSFYESLVEKERIKNE